MFGFWTGWAPLFDGLGDRPLDDDRVGPESFRALLHGFHQMDEHFRTAPSKRTCRCPRPAHVWYTDFFGSETVAILPTSSTEALSAYLQQLTMESNGKHVTRSTEVNYATGPIYWESRERTGSTLLPADSPRDRSSL